MLRAYRMTASPGCILFVALGLLVFVMFALLDEIVSDSRLSGRY
jgi:hypothetical protein